MTPSSARTVSAVRVPLRCRPFRRWKFIKALEVTGPHRPSTWQEEKPVTLSFCCRFRTWSRPSGTGSAAWPGLDPDTSPCWATAGTAAAELAAARRKGSKRFIVFYPFIVGACGICVVQE